mgnify:CR=1 FL=1
MSILTTHWLNQSKSNYVLVREWGVKEAPKGVIHLLHGMMEHSGYYHDWALKLSKFGWIVIAHDHPGSGLSVMLRCGSDHVPMDGAKQMVSISQYVDQWIRIKYPNLPIVRYGHSMGAFVAINGCLSGIESDGLILTGASFERKWILLLQQYFLRFMSFVKPISSKAKFANFITFFPLNRNFKPNKTKYDWLSRNRVALKRYLDDPLCGNTASWGYFYSLNQHLLTIISNKKYQRKLPSTLFIIGEYDPLSNFGKKILIYLKRNSQEYQSVMSYFIPGARHKVEYDNNQTLVLGKISKFLRGINEK